MARVVVASAAYLGDVAPYVAPANLLVDRGHDVTYLTPSGFHSMLAGERFRLATYPLDFSASAMHADPVHERLMKHPFLNQLRLARYWMRKGFVADPEQSAAALREHLDGADAVVSHPTFGSAVVPAAVALGIPVVVGQLFPMMIPTARWAPPVPLTTRSWGAPVNRALWRGLAFGSGQLMYDRTMNAHRRSLGLDRVTGNSLLAWTDAARTVVLVSRHYFGDEPDDWDDTPLVGFSPWSGPADRPRDPRVADFIDAGDAPVLVCLGTSAAAGAGDAFARIGRDLDAVGLRSLLLVGNDTNLAAVADRDGAFAFAPIDELVGRARVAVVSGALGTLAAALRAGVPVVVFPQLFDQVWHAIRVEKLGVGVHVRRPSQVVKAVAAIEADPRYAERARDLAARMAGEDGASALADAVVSVL